MLFEEFLCSMNTVIFNASHPVGFRLTTLTNKLQNSETRLEAIDDILVSYLILSNHNRLSVSLSLS